VYIVSHSQNGNVAVSRSQAADFRFETTLVTMMAQPLPAGRVVKPVPAGGCGVDVQMAPLAASVASLGLVAVHLGTCFKSG
jgi:hypothetical protein